MASLKSRAGKVPKRMGMLAIVSIQWQLDRVAQHSAVGEGKVDGGENVVAFGERGRAVGGEGEFEDAGAEGVVPMVAV